MIDLTGSPRRSRLPAPSAPEEALFSLTEQLIDDLPVALLIVRDGIVARVNDGWTMLTGMTAEQSFGFLWLDAVHVDDRALARELLEACERQRVSASDLRLRVAGDDTWVHARSRYVNGAPQTCVVTFTEIGTHKTTELHLLHRATHDELTGLANRAEFTKRLESLLSSNAREGRGAAVMFVDLDGFKMINDSHGHAVGDRLLRAVAQRLRQTVRPSDTVARFGGDEFAIVFPQVEDPTVAARLADRVITALTGPVVIQGVTLSVGGSVGIALSGGRDVTAAQLLDEADHAMYRAKSAGGNLWRLANAGDVSRLAHDSTTEASPSQFAADLRALMASLEQRVLLFLDGRHDMGHSEMTSVASIGELAAKLGSEIDGLDVSVHSS